MNILRNMRSFIGLADHSVFSDSHAEVNPIANLREVSLGEVKFITGGRNELAAVAWGQSTRSSRRRCRCKRKRCGRRKLYLITPR
jgi:hypothetical protein